MKIFKRDYDWEARKLRDVIGWVRKNLSGSRGILRGRKVPRRSNLQSPTCSFIFPLPSIMSSRSAWRALHHSAKRRAFKPATPYRCFSCTRRAQDQPKSEHDRMTHFGFTNVPESEKESRGMAFL